MRIKRQKTGLLSWREPGQGAGLLLPVVKFVSDCS